MKCFTLNWSSWFAKDFSFAEQAWEGSNFKLKNWHVPRETTIEQQTVAVILNLPRLKKIMATTGLAASLHLKQKGLHLPSRGKQLPTRSPCCTQLTLAGSSSLTAAFTNEGFHPRGMFSPPRHPEAEAHFTGSQITMFDLQNFLLKRKTPAGLWLKKKTQM